MSTVYVLDEHHLYLYVCISIQTEIDQLTKDIKQLKYRRQVLEEEKALLSTFAGHVSKIHSVEVSWRRKRSSTCESIDTYSTLTG